MYQDLGSWKEQTTAKLSGIPSGPAGIKTTLSVMSRLARDYKKNPYIRELALTLTNNLPQKSYTGEVRMLWDFVKNQIRYVRDINGVETLQTPLKTLEYRSGDCDDKSTLLASLLESIGHKTRFVAVGFAPGSFYHVYVETLYGDGKWIALETTEPVEMGWSPPDVRARMTVHN